MISKIPLLGPSMSLPCCTSRMCSLLSCNSSNSSFEPSFCTKSLCLTVVMHCKSRALPYCSDLCNSFQASSSTKSLHFEQIQQEGVVSGHAHFLTAADHAAAQNQFLVRSPCAWKVSPQLVRFFSSQCCGLQLCAKIPHQGPVSTYVISRRVSQVSSPISVQKHRALSWRQGPVLQRSGSSLDMTRASPL